MAEDGNHDMTEEQVDEMTAKGEHHMVANEQGRVDDLQDLNKLC